MRPTPSARGCGACCGADGGQHGECWNVQERSRCTSRAGALWALVAGVTACGACRPDTELSYFDG
ncbi:DUF6233 domain-containing protein [Streptomyces sp. NPDC048225]|uniref:DUF6233 domain-containing protein n=1 Tax=Streptomyces sp. NPDC048225 TaxID=3365518 RepID=UPI003721787D